MFLEIKLKNYTKKINISHIVSLETSEKYLEIEVITGREYHFPYSEIENSELVKEIVEKWWGKIRRLNPKEEKKQWLY